MSFGKPPTVPTQFQIYDSYAEDPKWQITFTKIWCGCLAAAVGLSAPRFLRAVRRRRAHVDLFGVRDDSGRAYESVTQLREFPRPKSKFSEMLAGILRMLGSVLLWSPLGVGLDVGQIIVCAGYIATVVCCIFIKAPLVDNPNRAGFLAIAQFPVVFLFATKNSVLSLLLGPGHGYDKLNYIHRWAGRGMFIGAVVHGALWIRNHLQYNLAILSQQKEGSGVAALAVLCLLVLLSLRPARLYFYQLFFYLHVMLYVAFFITVCYHTTYAPPWIFPPLAFYGLDIFMRILRYRIKDATLIPVDNQMTLIRIHDCDGGYLGGQHIRLRVFFEGRVFESHPLTIASAPPVISCLPSRDILLGARVKGDWTRALARYAQAEHTRLSASVIDEKDGAETGVPVQVMVDGPYGGCSLDLGERESVLLAAGGAGVTFTLGLLDDIVGRIARTGRARGERTRRIEFVWCIRSFGCIEWFTPQLMAIANAAAMPGAGLDLHFSIFVTCLCDPEAVPPIPNMRVTVERPSLRILLRNFAASSTYLSVENLAVEGRASPSSDEDLKNESRAPWSGKGGVAVCAAGPENFTREAHNAVARIALSESRRVGGIALHTETFAM
ncbi:ferric reductase like transmembrane component-domain-containing protein [Vararia minispora EC-137]|uniref:Ferric reductase like transmembrane component-domain-containing protein n=1 Tax=Vararia minispora EC-137 TaxID=1314806 RepID=A0ACB8Q7Z4_9AGAM|nr:ferric reductase like transmembrane component-domain-containing protein [Vararia minispora EC-137]